MVDTIGMKPQSVVPWPVAWLLPLFLAAWEGMTLSLMAAAPPVTITSPVDGAVLDAPASFQLRATVSGGGNSVAQIEFFQGTNSLGVDTDNPYRVDVNNLPAGTYTFTAILTDNSTNTSTNGVTIIVNELPVVTVTNPTDGAGLIAPASFDLQATASDVAGSVAQVQFFRGSTLIGTLTNAPYSVPVVRLASGNYRFDAVATDNLGGTTRARIDILVKSRPTVAFTAPASGARLFAMTNLVTGTADDSDAVDAVELSVNSGAFTPASGTKNWNMPLVLPAGTNVLQVRARDDFGNYSLTNRRSFFQVVTSQLTLTIQGTGTISGATNGQGLEVGRGYHLLATPGSNSVFSNWTGQVSGNSSTLNFIMQSNLVIQANFVPNPFLRVGGSYSGLFYETNGAHHESSGDVQLRVSSSGRYSAVLRLAGRRYATLGRLDLEGRATNVIVRRGTTPLTVRWTVDLQGLDEVTGTVTDGQWMSELRGDRAVFNAVTNPAPLMGLYTFVLPGSPAAGTPEGDGWGTLRVSSNGVGSATGKLADGTDFLRKAPVSKNGSWPLYAPLYRSKGSLLGWIQFDTNAPLTDLGGSVAWWKPEVLGGRFYPAGLTFQTTLAGSRYVAPATSTNRVLDLTNGVAILTGGNLSQAWTNEFILGANNRVTNTSLNSLSVTLSLPSGTFKGSFYDTGVVRSVSFSGVLLQKSTSGSGFFLGTNQSGRVLLEGRP